MSSTSDFIIVEGVLEKYNGSAETVVVPDGVKTIGRAFLKNDRIKEVTLPVGLTRIDGAAVSFCTNLEKNFVSESADEIGNYAFSGCTNLQSVVLPKE